MADDSIAAVPGAMRDGALALGSTKSETIRKVLIPAALPGIVGGVLLGVSRAIGETIDLMSGWSKGLQTSMVAHSCRERSSALEAAASFPFAGVAASPNATRPARAAACARAGAAKSARSATSASPPSDLPIGLDHLTALKIPSAGQSMRWSRSLGV